MKRKIEIVEYPNNEHPTIVVKSCLDGSKKKIIELQQLYDEINILKDEIQHKDDQIEMLRYLNTNLILNKN
ncbi:hypothetical protein [Dasineura jujubifolia toursvirus 2a]|nr:hypothetical protein [Dasineura jujubifolia toursvirus 2a]